MEKIAAAKLKAELDNQGLPPGSAWETTKQVSFYSDWRGEHADPKRETCVWLLWSPDRFFVRYECRYRSIFVYDGGNCRRDRLWMRDVAELFLHPETDEPRRYREFEISPNGDWLDLDISPGEKSILHCDLKSRVVINPERRIWTAEMSIPTNCLSESFDPGAVWRVNFFRIEGEDPDRFYSAWRPTYTIRPNFHVPEAFGVLQFLD
jgi:hypothetical protein